MMPSLREKQKVPPPRRHPLVYLAAISLVLSIAAFLSGFGLLWVGLAAGLAVLLGIGAIVLALNNRGVSA